MADKDFKVKNKLVVKGISSAGPLTIDASGNVDSTSYIPTQYGGTGTSTSPTSGQVLYSASGTNYAATDLSSLTISNSGGSTITSSSASVKGLIIKGASSQTADLQQWQDSSSSVLASIASSGLLDLSAVNGTWSALLTSNIGDKIGLWTSGGATSFGFGIQASRTVAFVPSGSGFSVRKAVSSGDKSSGTDAVVLFETGAITQTLSSASVKGLVIKGAASQSANLQEWQDSSGNALLYVSANADSIFRNGNFYLRTLGNNSINIQPYISAGSPVATFNFNSIIFGTYAPITPASASAQGLIIKGVASQTANLQEWQNSSGTVLASISAAGNLTVQDLTVNGTTTTINSTTLTVDDKNIELASVTSPTDTTADGAGITIKGATDKTFNWVQSTGAFTSSEPISTPALSVTGNSVSSDITLVAGKRYFVDTTAARTLTLPASPSVGNEIQIFDASNSAGTYNITIDSNSNKLSGSVQNLIIDTNAAAVFLVYTGSTYGWMVL